MSEVPPEGGQPSEAELRAAYEAELARIDSADMIAQALVSMLNLGALRLAPAGEGGPPPDLEQARDAIDAARALLEVLERRRPEDAQQLRGPLSQLQMAFAREVPPPAAGQEGEAAEGPDADKPGPAQASGRLWVPGS